MRQSPDRRALIGGLTGAALASALPAFGAASPTLSFLALGDWGREGEPQQRAVAAQMALAGGESGAGFVLALGDNFYRSGVTSVGDPQWRSSFVDVYADPALQIPWYAALGNHDYLGSPQAQLDYSLTSNRWRMPERYYRISGADVGFPDLDIFVLDTSPLVGLYRLAVGVGSLRANVLSQDPAAQLAWLDRELAASTAKWKLVVGHHTIVSGGVHGPTEDLARVLPDLFRRRGVQAYINGHDHDLQHLERDGVAYVCAGAGSRSRPVRALPETKFCAERTGFAAFRLSAEALNLEFRDAAGQSLYRADIRP